MNTFIKILAVIVIVAVFAFGAAAYLLITGQTLSDIIPPLFITIGVAFLMAAVMEFKPFRRNKNGK